jgi:hypothetical protein
LAVETDPGFISYIRSDAAFVIVFHDSAVLRLLRLFKTRAGRQALVAERVPAELAAELDLLGIANLPAVIKLAR